VSKYSFLDWSAKGPKFKTVKDMYDLTEKVRFGGPLAKASLKDYLVKRILLKIKMYALIQLKYSY
jgi:hypothetical protein